jgi:hypothetical protein
MIQSSLMTVTWTQEPRVPPDTVITLERTSCFGPCPTYTVRIDAGGTVTWFGNRFVRATGRQTTTIAPSLVATLLDTAQAIDFFAMRDTYRVMTYPDGTSSSPTDMPTHIVTITSNGQTKRVEDYWGAPEDLARLERDIDMAAGTKRWIFLDEQTLQELTQAGWVATTEEGAILLQEAIRRDDLPIAQRLIELGGDLAGPSTDRFPPLLLAQSGPMVDLLVKAGADPNERSVGRVSDNTALLAAYYKDAGVAMALLRAGARLEDMDHGETALWRAACAGNWGVVSVLLGAGANPRGSARVSAAECARQSRQDAVNRTRSRRQLSGQPKVEDFDRVLVMLGNAEKNWKR